MLSTMEFFQLIKQGKIEAVKDAIVADPSLVNAHDTNNASAVLTAAYYGEPAVASLLIQYGANLNLFEACAVGDLPTVQALVNTQPELVNAFAPDGFQPLGLAAFFGNLPVAEILINAGAAVDSPSQNPLRVMPLHSAAAGSHTDIVRLLIAHGAPLNARQEEGFAPLHSAAQNGSIEILNLLLDSGAEVNVRNAAGKTPLTLALAANHMDAAALLRVQGAVE